MDTVNGTCPDGSDGGSRVVRRVAQRIVRMMALAIAGSAALAALSTAVASAATDSLTVTVATATPEQAVPVTLQFSGSATQASSLLAVARPAGGIGCQPTYESDTSAAGNADWVLFGHYDAQENPGSFSEQATYTPQNPGSYLLCAWLERNDNNRTLAAGPISATFTARGPQVAQLTVGLAGSARPQSAFQIAYTTQTDQQLHLYSVVKPAGGLACASSYELETQQNQTENVVLGDYDEDVFGGPTTTTQTDTESHAGPYVICTWIEGPNSGEVDAATSTSIYVGSPPAPPACQVPSFTAGTVLSALEQSLTSNHCAVGAVTYAFSRKVHKGGVLSLSAPAGAKLASGAPVAITLSAGPPPPACRVPTIRRGAALRKTEHAVIVHHCTVGHIRYRHNRRVRRGRVIEVSPRSGSRRPSGSAVAITVSTGATSHKRRRPHRV